jgi:hypothetical protein
MGEPESNEVCRPMLLTEKVEERNKLNIITKKEADKSREKTC